MKIIVLEQILRAVSSNKNAKAAYTYVDAKATYVYKNVKAIPSYALARFVRLYLDITALYSRATFTDSQVKDVNKQAFDTVAVLETVLKRTETARQELATVLDEVALLTDKTQQDSASFVDISSHVVGKSATDQIALLEDISADISKTLTDLVYLTDDIGGEATIDDDQYLFVSKTLLDLGTSVSDLVDILVSYQRSFSDQFSFTDTNNLSVGKVLQDAAGFSEARFLSLGKQLTQDLAQLADQITLTVQYFRSVADGALAQDQTYRETTKALAESAAFSDIVFLSMVFYRAFSEALTIAESVTLQLEKALGDQFNLTEDHTLLTGKSAVDTLSSTDSGVLLSQGYVDNPFYFADDYVGTKRTF